MVQGLLHAIATQKLVMIREKRLINCAVPAKNQYGNFGYNNNTFQSSEKYKKHTEVVDVDLRFNFAPYVSSEHEKEKRRRN